MKALFDKLRQRSFSAYLIAFLGMMLPSVGLAYVAETGGTWLIWILLGMVILANLLAILV